MDLKAKAAILIILAILAYISVLAWLLRPEEDEPYLPARQYTEGEKRVIKAAIGRHGDYPMYQSKLTGRIWMVRDGQEIRIL